MSKFTFNSATNPSYENMKKRSLWINSNNSVSIKKCSDRCSFTFSYGLSTCTITNKGAGHFELSYDDSASNVFFNGSKYIVYKVNLFVAPIHQYGGQKNKDATFVQVNGKTIIGELIIHHKSESYGDDLLVCVPVVTTSDKDKFSILDEAINSSSIERNEAQTVLVDNYSLSEFVPVNPFYYYYGQSPFGRISNSKVHCICFDPTKGDLPTINSKDLESRLVPLLTVSPYRSNTRDAAEKVINSQTYSYMVSTVDFNSNTVLYYNEAGPSKSATESDIYIDCKPISEEKEIKVENQKTLLNKIPGASKLQQLFGKGGDGKVPTVEEILNHKWFGIIFAIVAFFIVWQAWSFIGDKITGKKSGAGAAAAKVKLPKTVVKGEKL